MKVLQVTPGPIASTLLRLHVPDGTEQLTIQLCGDRGEVRGSIVVELPPAGTFRA